MATSGRADTILDWTFEQCQTSPPAGCSTGTSPSLSDDTGNGGTFLGISNGTLTFDTAVVGDGSAHAIHATDFLGSGVDSFQFNIPVQSFSNIGITWDQASSAGGPGNFKLQWSTDDFATSINTVGTFTIQVNGGTHYMNNPSNPSMPAWNSTSAASITVTGLGTFDPYQLTAATFSAPSANSIRLLYSGTTSANGGTVDATGTTRIDNMTIIEFAPEPSTWAGMLGGLMAIGIYRCRRR